MSSTRKFKLAFRQSRCIDIRAPIKVVSYAVNTIQTSIMAGLDRGARFLPKPLTNLWDDSTTVIYYTVAGAAVGACADDILGSVAGLLGAYNSIWQQKAILVKNQKSCWEGLQYQHDFSVCTNNATLDKVLQVSAVLASIEKIPSVDAVANSFALAGALLGALLGFINAYAKAQRKQITLGSIKRATLRNALAIDSAEIYGHARWTMMTYAMCYMSTFFPMMLSMATSMEDANRVFYKTAIQYTGNYPSCTLNYNADGCKMITGPDTNMTARFCDAVMSVVDPQFPFWRLRFVQTMSIASVIGWPIGFFKAAKQVQERLDYKEYEKEKEKTSSPELKR